MSNIGYPNTATIMSLKTHPGHWGEWIFYRFFSNLPYHHVIHKDGTEPEDILKHIPTNTGNHPSELSYIICLESSHPLATQDPSRATFAWPGAGFGQLTPTLPAIRQIEADYEVPPNPVYFGSTWEYLGSPSIPLSIASSKAEWFASYIESLKLSTHKALEKALHQ